MSKEKQIEEIDELETVLYEANHKKSVLDYRWLATEAYNAGYLKQSEGEWHYNPDGMDWGLGAWQCSVCGCNNNSLPMDKNIKPLRWAGAKYCGNCGAKMKGGAE